MFFIFRSARPAGASRSCQTLGLVKTAVRSALSVRTVPPGPSTRVASRCFPARNQMRSHPAASSHSRKSTRHLARRSTSQSSRCRFQAEGGYALCQLVVRASRGLTGQFVVGAPRRSAAPGSQSVGAAGYGSIVSVCCYSSPMLSKARFPAYQCKAACPRVRPNPSIERTCTGRPRYARSSFSASRGLPVRAAHVKR